MRNIFLALFIVLCSSLAGTTYAATLSLNPSSGNFTIGNIFTVQVLVNSYTTSINEANGTINFPSSLLEVLSISKSDSIFPLWVEEPSFSNTAGTITFDGGLPTPGFTGNGGNILNITFEVKNAGFATVLFSSSAVRANDGNGTDVLTSTIPASFDLFALINTVKQPSIISPTSTSPENVSSSTTSGILPPQITPSSTNLQQGSVLQVNGVTYPGSLVNLFLVNTSGATSTESVTSNMFGSFSLIWPNKLNSGKYELFGETINGSGLESPLSVPILITVNLSHLMKIWLLILAYFMQNMLIMIILILILVLLLIWYLVHRFSRLEKKITHIVSDAEAILQDFNVLGEEMSTHINLLQETKNKRPLTEEETIILNQLQKYLDIAEQDIDKVKALKK